MSQNSAISSVYRIEVKADRGDQAEDALRLRIPDAKIHRIKRSSCFGDQFVIYFANPFEHLSPWGVPSTVKVLAYWTLSTMSDCRIGTLMEYGNASRESLARVTGQRQEHLGS